MCVLCLLKVLKLIFRDFIFCVFYLRYFIVSVFLKDYIFVIDEINYFFYGMIY